MSGSSPVVPEHARQRAAVVVAYLAALSRADVAGVLACVTDDFVNEHTSALGSSCSGRDAYAERLPGFFDSLPGLRYDVVELLADEADDVTTSVAARYVLTAKSDGSPITIPGVMLFTVRAGRIARRTDFWDSLTFLRQTER